MLSRARPFAAPIGSEENGTLGRSLEGLGCPKKEAGIALARVVSFEGVSADRIEQIRSEIRAGERPQELPATEIVVPHDPEAEKSLAILFFETEDDYRRGDEILGAMPGEETPGQRTSVAKYDVAVRPGFGDAAARRVR